MGKPPNGNFWNAVYVLDLANGGAIKQLASPAGHPAFSSDDKQIVFVSKANLKVLTLETGDIETVVRRSGDYSSPDWKN